MPNHVHILISPKIPLSDESFDHWVRSPEQFDTIRAYIENNPVKAGLAAHPEDWPWSSCTAIFG